MGVIFFSHSLPKVPSGQTQKKVDFPSMHSAPFLHLFGLQPFANSDGLVGAFFGFSSSGFVQVIPSPSYGGRHLQAPFSQYAFLSHLAHLSSAHVGPSYRVGQTHVTLPSVNSHFPPLLQGSLFSPFFGKQALSSRQLSPSYGSSQLHFGSLSITSHVPPL